MDNKYDFIIAGSGCAGLSLLYQLLCEPQLSRSRILVLDKEKKGLNDRTWCFWEKDPGPFESIVFHKWNTLAFYSKDVETVFDLKQYTYKMIRGNDFYDFVLSKAKAFSNVHFEYTELLELNEEEGLGIVKTKNGVFCADYVFNSTSLFLPEISRENSLLQHFKGWVIKTKEPHFDTGRGTLMDFRLDQSSGATFMYVLPHKANEALIEYTLFTPEVLEQKEYESALADYIEHTLNISEYTIEHEEYGVIPMSLATFSRSRPNSERIINIGTAGGFTKASSGYTFQFVQRNTSDIIERLRAGKSPLIPTSRRARMFEWYDRTLLDVMINKKMTGSDIFSIMFKKLPPEFILSFLANDTSISQDLRVMNSVPLGPFLSSAFKQIIPGK